MGKYRVVSKDELRKRSNNDYEYRKLLYFTTPSIKNYKRLIELQFPLYTTMRRRGEYVSANGIALIELEKWYASVDKE